MSIPALLLFFYSQFANSLLLLLLQFSIDLSLALSTSAEYERRVDCIDCTNLGQALVHLTISSLSDSFDSSTAPLLSSSAFSA
mmetsp:Transcript_12854/g.29547  ORF Transcript_12854/g.29547 Transcript_12854/m.29547 type:complete len:83 (-) Transcript_12854:527-775(-)